MTMSLNVTSHAAEASTPGNVPDETAFPVATRVLEGIAQDVLRFAREGGASAAATEVSQAVGQSVTVRKGDVETIAYNRDKGISVTVYLGQQRGSASTADFAPASLRAAVGKALAIARYTAADPAAGLADPARLATEEQLARTIRALDLYHPWRIGVDEAIALGKATEAAALAVDRRITNSDGATLSAV